MRAARWAELLGIAASWQIRHVANKLALPRAVPFPRTIVPTPECHARASQAITHWEHYEPTPLRAAPELAAALELDELWLKDESARLNTGSFKALGGGYAVEQLLGDDGLGRVIATASAGNHGVGIAAACRRLGAACHVFLHSGVSEIQAERIRALGGTVHRCATYSYEESLAEARREAEANSWMIVQDVSWEGYTRVPSLIFAGYTVLAAEIVEQLAAADAPPPTHVLINAGVGGLAAAVSAHLAHAYGSARPRVVLVEPHAADCNLHSARLGAITALPDARLAAESTIQTGLDVAVPDALAWEVVSRATDDFVAVPDAVVSPCVALLAEEVAPPIHAGDSAVAGLGVLLAAAAQPSLRAKLQLDRRSRVAVIVCEGAFRSPL